MTTQPIKAFYVKERRRCWNPDCGRITDKGFEVRDGPCRGFFCSKACYEKVLKEVQKGGIAKLG